MKRPWLWSLIAAGVVLPVGLTFVYPSVMVSPGPLLPGHAELTGKCFSCHAPFRGVAGERCLACHALPDIGIRTTRGVPVSPRAKSTTRASFHQALNEPDCTSCHTDHQKQNQKKFSHTQLRPAALEHCETCHSAPANDLHKNLSTGCNQCHKMDHWKPATFQHDQFFTLDRDHNAACATCHTKSDFKVYTCFGCHEHTPANIAAEHEEEGIRDLTNCASCHRSGEGESGERGEGREHGEEREHGERH